MYELKLMGDALLGRRLVQCEIGISEGRIAKIGKHIGEAESAFVFKKEVMLPGVIDTHAHFREPGATYKEDWESGSKAAAHGGVTLIFDMPNTMPPTTTLQRVEEKKRLAGSKCIIDYRICGGVRKGNIHELAAMAPAVGAFGEIFMCESFGELQIDRLELFEAYKEIAKTGKVAITHAEDPDINAFFREKFKKRENPTIHSEVRPPLSESLAVATALQLARGTGVKLHLTHISTKESIMLIRNIKRRADVTCDVTPHHLFLTEENMKELGNFGKMNPPLRSREDQTALWKGIATGVVDMVASDHAPHTKEEKKKPYWEAPAGVPGIETMLPLMLTAVKRKWINLYRMSKLLSISPAKRHGLYPQKGVLAEGSDADIVVVDLNKKREIRGKDLHTKCKWTPFEGFQTVGVPVMTVSRGRIVYSQPMQSKIY
ncbi:MAG: dihydroorotase [Candidatus Micrarchaeota archaeon]|nr:dihydroorotase [Candidatus Micrarchaeota archaeon]